MRDLLAEYSDIFSTGTFDMGRTSLVEHSIDTGSHRPIRQALRRHPRAHLDEIDSQVDGLLENGLIEPAASPRASNIVSVKKKDGSFRLCVDYRRLNSVTNTILEAHGLAAGSISPFSNNPSTCLSISSKCARGCRLNACRIGR